MNYKEDLGTKVIKRFYGITGPLDEYRYQEINRIGNNAFIFLWIYLMISNLVALYFGVLYPEITLYIYIGLNTLITVFGVAIYILWESKRKQLTEVDIEELDVKIYKCKMIKSTIIGAILYGLFMSIFNSLMNIRFEDANNFFTYWVSEKNMIVSLVQTIGFGLLMYIVQYYRLKKIIMNKESDHD